MRGRVIWCACTALTLAVVVTAQSPPPSVLRTADGHPDLQGTCTPGPRRPLNARRSSKARRSSPPEEAAAFERRTAERRRDVVAVHGPEWLDYGSHVGADRRTSIVVDPPDGRVPPLTPRRARRRLRGARWSRADCRQPGGVHPAGAMPRVRRGTASSAGSRTTTTCSWCRRVVRCSSSAR